MCTPDIFLGLIAILFPPIAVWVKRGLCSIDSFINIALCCLGFIPGLLHAWYVIAATPDYDYELAAAQSDVERGHIVVHGGAGAPGAPPGAQGGVMYYYVQGNNRVPVSASKHAKNAKNYGTLGQDAPAAQARAGPAAGPAAQSSSSSAALLQPAQEAGEGVGDEVPPSYADVVKWDNKVQHP